MGLAEWIIDGTYVLYIYISGDDDELSSDEHPFEPSVEELMKQKHRRGSAKFSKYEMALLWNELKDQFPDGKVNRIQLAQLLHKVRNTFIDLYKYGRFK